MAEIRFTPHQREAVEAVGGSLLVSAAAGSGKTAVLTERVIRMLTGEDAISADRLIVVTFTVAAADEMRRRIGARLTELLEADPENEWLQSQQLLLPRAKISTIHSLCSGLIRDNFQKLGLSGEIRIAEEADLAVIKEQACAAVFEELYAQEYLGFLELVEFTCRKNDKPLTSLVLATYDFIRSFSFPLDFLDGALAQYEGLLDSGGSMESSVWMESVSAHVHDALVHCEGILSDCIEEMSVDSDVLDQYFDAFHSDYCQLSYIRQLLEQNRFAEAAECARSMQKLALKPVRKYDFPDFLDYLKGRRKKVYDIVDNVFSRYLCYSEEDFRDDLAILTPKLRALFGVVRRMYDLIETEKQEQGIIDYSDLEHFTLRLLVEKTEDGYRRTEAAEDLSRSFDQIMIDECQDINEVQNLIFTLLSRDETNLFMVGDVKQSIYRFRKAMPKLFIDKKNAFTPYSAKAHTDTSKETIILETNFRSRREVCDIVNYLFSQIMTASMGEINYGEEERLVAGAQYPEYEGAVPEIHILDYQRDNEDAKAVVEARYLAGLIHRMVEERHQVTDGNSLRDCTYGDFAILLRSYRDKAPLYAAELKKRGIPCFSASSEGYFDAYEVTVVLNLLHVVDNPLLDVPLLSVLMSPMFAFSADRIAEIRLARRNVPFYLALSELAERGDVPCADFVRFLSALRQKAATLRIDALIREIYDQTDFIALSYMMGDGEQKDANLRLLLTYAEKYENVGAGGLSGFLRYLDRVRESGGDFSAANTISAHSDAVRILSIHASKGLEFPICIVANCGKKFNKSDLNRTYQMNAQLGFSMKINDPETLRSYTSFPFEAIRLASEKESISEEMRVLYVAMTRAKEKLILVMTLQNAENRLRSIADSAGEHPTPYEVFSAQGYDNWILSVLLRHPGFAEIRERIGRNSISLITADFPVRGIFVPVDANADRPEETVREFTAPVSAELGERLREAIYYRYPNEPLTRIPAKLTVTEIAKQAREESLSLSARPAFLQKQGFTPAQRGTILHSFMQYADYSAAERDLAAEVERLTKDRYLTPEEAGALNIPKVEAFLQSPLYARMKAADELMREYKFLYFVPAGEIEADLEPRFAEEEILIQGIADCLIFEGNEITIVDYKTDYTNDPGALAERYYDQLRIYRDAIEQAFSEPVKECLLYSLHLERQIRIELPESALKRAGAPSGEHW